MIKVECDLALEAPCWAYLGLGLARDGARVLGGCEDIDRGGSGPEPPPHGPAS